MKRWFFLLLVCCSIGYAADAQVINGASRKYNNHVAAGNVVVYFPAKVSTLESAMLLDYFIKYFRSIGQYTSEAPLEEDGYTRQFSIRLHREKNVYVIGLVLIGRDNDDLDAVTKAAWQQEAKQISVKCFQGAEVRMFLGNGDYTTSEKRMVSSAAL